MHSPPFANPSNTSKPNLHPSRSSKNFQPKFASCHLYNTHSHNPNRPHLQSSTSCSNLSDLMHIQNQNSSRINAISPSKPLTYNKHSFPLTTPSFHPYITLLPKRKLNFPKVQSNQMKPLNPPSKLLDLNKALFTHGKGIKEQDYLEFRNNYLLKFASASESCSSLSSKLTQTQIACNKHVLPNLLSQLKLAYEDNIKVIFDKIKPDEVVDYVHWKQNITNYYTTISSLFEVVDVLTNEIRNDKYEHGKMKNKLMHSETKLTFYSTKCDDLNRVIKAHEKELNEKKPRGTKEQLDVKQQQQQRNVQNAQMIEMFRLENEVKDLTMLLNTNKEYYSKYKATYEMLETKKKEMEEMRSELVSELKDKTIKMAVTSNECQSLQSQMDVLEEERQRYMEVIDACRRESISDKTQVKKLSLVIEEKNNIINMLNEDMNVWLQYYDNEKREHALTMNELHMLESRVLRAKEEKRS